MTRNFIQRGPDLHTPYSSDSLGIQIHSSLLRNPNKRSAFIDVLTGETLSYAELLHNSCRLAESMRNAGFKIGDMLAISSENNVQFFQPVIAALYLGMIVVPINHNYIEAELLHPLNLTKPKIIFCSSSVVQKFKKAAKSCDFIRRIVVLNSTSEDGMVNFMDKFSVKSFDVHNFKPTQVDIEQHVAAILSSSGTTGLPKGVMTTHKNIIVRNVHACDSRLFTSDENVTKLGFLPFFHGYGFNTTLSSIIMSEQVVILTRIQEALFLKTIETYKITQLNLVPPLALMIAKSNLLNRYDVSSLKEILVGAAPLSEEIETEVKKRLNNIPVRQAYGLSESTLAVTINYQGKGKSGSSGEVVPGTQIKIRDPETGKNLGPNFVGEVCIKGDLVMKGYYNNPEATRNTFTSDGWLLTGDLAYFDENNQLFVVDRLKELIKYKGFQVAPAELEALLLTHPAIKDAGVIGIPDEKAGEVAFAFVVKIPNAKIIEKDVLEFVAGRVSHPKHLHGGVRFIDAIPKSQSGKILRRELRDTIKRFNSKL